MRCRLAVVLIGFVMIANVPVLAQEQDGDTIILDTSGFWRVHYTLKPPMMRKGENVQPVKFRKAWLNTSTPLPPKDWAGPDFDDSAWSRFPGVLPGHLNPYGSNMGDPKLPLTALVCMRGKFRVTDPDKVKTLSLSASYRGGIVLYLNGTEIARGHLPKGPKTGLDSLADDYAEGEEHTRELGDVKIPRGVLRKGVNVLAVEVRRSAYQEKDVKVARRGRIVITWGSCGLIRIRVAAPNAEGIVPNIARPRGLQVWNSNPLVVDQDLDYGDPNETLGPIELVGTRNGAFSGKVVVGSSEPIKRLTARMSDIAHTTGKGRIPASRVQVRYAKAEGKQAGSMQRYLMPTLRFDGLAEVPPDEVPVRKHQPNKWRDRHRMQSPGVSASYGAVQPVWVTVNVPRDSEPGDYAGKLTITVPGEKPVEVPVKLKVCAWTVPDPPTWHTWVDIIQSPESVAMQYDVPVWSDEHFKRLEESVKLLGQVGNKVVYLPLICETNQGNAQSIVRWIKQKDGTYKHDLAPMKKYLDFVQKHQGKPAILCLYVWDTYLEGGRIMTPKGFGPAIQKDRMAHQGKGALVSLLDEATGKVETTALPMYSTPEKSKPLWRPLMEEVLKDLKERGWEKTVVLGIMTDNRPTKEVVEFFKDLCPGVPWMASGHGHPAVHHGVPCIYGCHVYGGMVFAGGPEMKRLYGWKRPDLLMHFPRMGWWSYPMSAYRLVGEMNIAGAQRGFMRLGADFWPVHKGRRGGAYILASRYPKTSWRNLEIRSCLLSPGKNGAVSTARFEMLREGLQECEARIFIEKAILEKKIDGELARRCQAVLDERIPNIQFGASSLSFGQYGGLWWSHPGVMGYCWYVGSNWQQRSQALYEAAAEVARKTGTH